MPHCRVGKAKRLRFQISSSSSYSSSSSMAHRFEDEDEDELAVRWAYLNGSGATPWVTEIKRSQPQRGGTRTPRHRGSCGAPSGLFRVADGTQGVALGWPVWPHSGPQNLPPRALRSGAFSPALSTGKHTLPGRTGFWPISSFAERQGKACHSDESGSKVERRWPRSSGAKRAARCTRNSAPQKCGAG